MATVEMSLKQELDTYQANKERLLAESAGKYVVIHGNTIAGTWSSYEDALKEGYEKFGLAPFLVKRIEGVESIVSFSRDV